MTPHEVKKIYDANVKSAEIFINNISNNKNGVLINSAITSSYLGLVKNDPPFLWLALGSLVSCTVGKNIHFSSLAHLYSLGMSNPAETILKEFAKGNQHIFKSIVPIYKTFQQVGIEGIKLLQVLEGETPFKNKFIQDAFSAYSDLQANLNKISKSLNLPNNHPKVIEVLFSDPINEKLANDAAYNIAIQEQTEVQEMYNNNDLVSYMMNPLLGFIGHQFKLDGVEIDGVSYNMMDFVKNPADIDQRMFFVKILTNALMECVKTKGIESVFADIQSKSDYMLYLANPHTSPDKMGGINGYFWGNEAEIYEKDLIAKIDDFVKFVPSGAEYLDQNTGPWQEMASKVFQSVFKDCGHSTSSANPLSKPSGVGILSAKQAANVNDLTSELDDVMLDENSETNKIFLEKTAELEDLLESFSLEISETVGEMDTFSDFPEIETLTDSLETQEIIIFEDFNDIHFDDVSCAEENVEIANKEDSCPNEPVPEDHISPLISEIALSSSYHQPLTALVSEPQTESNYIFE